MGRLGCLAKATPAQWCDCQGEVWFRRTLCTLKASIDSNSCFQNLSNSAPELLTEERAFVKS